MVLSDPNDHPTLNFLIWIPCKIALCYHKRNTKIGKYGVCLHCEIISFSVYLESKLSGRSNTRRNGWGFESNDGGNIFQLHVDLKVMKCAYEKSDKIYCKVATRLVHHTIFYRRKILMFGINTKSCYHFKPYVVGGRCFFSSFFVCARCLNWR